MSVEPPIIRERRRLGALSSLQILDTEPEEEYDEVVHLLAHSTDTPIALVSLVDAGRLWFKARHGLDVVEIDGARSFCCKAVELPDQALIVPDAREDSRFCDNGLVQGPLAIRFYAGAPLRLSTGEVVGTLCVLDQRPRELDADMVRLLEVLGHQVSKMLDLRRTTVALQDDRRRRTDALRQTAHELAGPLVPLEMHAAALREELGSAVADTIVQRLESIEHAAGRLGSLVEDLRFLARGDDVVQRVEPDTIDMVEHVSRVVEGHQEVAVRNDVKLDLALPDSPVWAWVDAARFDQVVGNLLANAIAFSPFGARIDVRLEQSGGDIVLSVRDRGAGVPSHRRDAIFEPLFTDRTEARPDATGGTGLGLHICRQLVEAHHGSIGVVDAAPGACFEVRLPRLGTEADRVQTSPTSAAL